MVSALSSSSGSTSNFTIAKANSSSQSTDAEVQAPRTVAPKKASSNSADTCAWYTGTRCYMPRDCYDCINTAIRLDSCAVDPSGSCVSMSAYTEEARREGDLNDPDFLGYFPAVNFTYCTSADDTCQQCKQTWRQKYGGSGGYVPRGETCVGASGCICIAACEMPNRAMTILNKECPSFSGKIVTQIYLGVGLCGMVLLGVFVFRAWLRKRQDAARAEARRERRERWRNRPTHAGPALALTGWNSLRDKLLETEREFIDGEKPSLIAPGAQRDATDEDAEDQDSDVSSSDEEERAHHIRAQA